MLITSNSSPASGERLEDGAMDAERMEFAHLVPESSHTIEIQYISHVPELHIYDSDATVAEETIVTDTQIEYVEEVPADEFFNSASCEESAPSNECSADSFGFDDSGETDLTNLNWLQNITNILPVPSFSMSPKPPPKPFIQNMRLHKFKQTIAKCQDDFAKNVEEYKSNNTKKPPYSYCSLICLAMRHNDNKMTLSAIYNWIRENFKYYKHADPTWQNSIRHNLSLNQVFVKVARSKHEPGKGGFWKLDLARLEDSRKYKKVLSPPKPPKKQKGAGVTKKNQKQSKVDVVEQDNYDEMFEITKRATDSISDLSNQLPDFSLDSLELVLSNTMENDFGPNVIVESVAAEEELGALLLAAPWEDLQPELTDSLFDSYLK